jgi:hypothetical protein
MLGGANSNAGRLVMEDADRTTGLDVVILAAPRTGELTCDADQQREIVVAVGKLPPRPLPARRRLGPAPHDPEPRQGAEPRFGAGQRHERPGLRRLAELHAPQH